jgi:hypothetical protein
MSIPLIDLRLYSTPVRLFSQQKGYGLCRRAGFTNRSNAIVDGA